MKDFKNVTDLSDRQLLFYARKYGTQALLWRQKFIGLLPEVHKRRLWEAKGYSSIFEFGKRMAGLSEAQIRLTLNLEKRFTDKPHLHEALVKGKVSINKLTRVASVANSENEAFLAETAKSLSKSSLDVVVQTFKRAEHEKGDELKIQNGLPLPQNECKSLPGQKFQLDEKLIEKLNELTAKGLDVNDILLELLEKRECEIKQQKQIEGEKVSAKKSKGRYISVKSKQILHQEFGAKCAVPNCQKQKQHIHHVLPHALLQNNDPRFLLPLCKEHHDIVHSVNQKYMGFKM